MNRSKSKQSENPSSEIFYQFFRTLSPVVFILATGVIGYSLIEGWSVLDALYMTVITLTTVGFAEVHTLSDGGKIFTMVLIVIGIGNVALVVSKLSGTYLNPLFSSVLNEKKMKKRLRELKDHYIICGMGRIGTDVTRSLHDSGISLVVVDAKPLNENIKLPENIPVIIGDASNDEILIRAGIENARGLVASVKSEAENLFITLTARELRSDLYIISRFEEDATKKKLLRAGANQVINPYQIGSQKISQIILKPTITKILDFAQGRGEFNLSIDELDLQSRNSLIGKTLTQCKIKEEHNIIIIAIESANGEIVTNPGPNHIFKEHDRIVMIANQSELRGIITKFSHQHS